MRLDAADGPYAVYASPRCETVGTVHPHVECKVVDHKGKVVPVGATGELLTKVSCWLVPIGVCLYYGVIGHD